MPFLLILGALVVIAGGILLVLWHLADRRTRPRIAAGELQALRDRLEEAEAECLHLQRRIEHLEAIASAGTPHNGL